MIIVQIIGGLGNQMFQYSYAEMLRVKGYLVKLDISAFKTYNLHGGYQLLNFNTDIDIATTAEANLLKESSFLKKISRKISLKNRVKLKEKSLCFNKQFLTISDHTYIEGYFQSEKYFKDIRKTILKKFTLNKELSMFGKYIADRIVNAKKSCSIHIRRGDYLNNTNKNLFGTCSLEYYNDAVALINNEFGDTVFFIFSNDIEWCKTNLDINNAIFIDSSEERIPNEDIYLMSLCHHNIIANSSFSWWGSWLNQYSDKIVIAPKKWFIDEKLLAQSGDIVPDNYIKI